MPSKQASCVYLQTAVIKPQPDAVTLKMTQFRARHPTHSRIMLADALINLEEKLKTILVSELLF